MWSKIKLKCFGKVKVIKAPAGIELMAYSFVINALAHCATLSGNNFLRENLSLYHLAHLKHIIHISQSMWVFLW